MKAGDMAYIAGSRSLRMDRPTIVFVHGSGGSSVLWHAQVEALAGEVNTVALDLPGHGRSGGAGRRKVEDYAAVVEDFIRTLEITRPVVCGLSLGGAVVLHLLLERPGKMEAGIIVNSGARLRVAPMIFQAIDNDYAGFVDATASMAVSAKTDTQRIKPLLESMAACSPEVTRGDFEACDAFDVMDRLEEIKVPVLVLTASEDRLTPAKYGKYLAEHIARSVLVHIEEAGHLSPMEKPEEVTGAVREFVRGLV